MSKKKNENCVNTIQHKIIDNSYHICYILDFYTDTPVLLQLIAHRDKEDELLESLGISEKIFTVMNKKKLLFIGMYVLSLLKIDYIMLGQVFFKKNEGI